MAAVAEVAAAVGAARVKVMAPWAVQVARAAEKAAARERVRAVGAGGRLELGWMEALVAAAALLEVRVAWAVAAVQMGEAVRGVRAAAAKGAVEGVAEAD